MVCARLKFLLILMLPLALYAEAPTTAAPAAVARTALAPAQPATLASNEIQARANAKIFQLLTRISTGTQKQSYGTAFVVDPRGLLITNYHVVSSFVLHPSLYALELKVGEQMVPARILALDVPNDLAIVQVGRSFTDYYRISTKLPSPGEKLFSIGIPEDTVLTIIQGLFSDIRRDDPTTRLLFSAPLNHGMSGGPLLNEREEVVGVNDAILGKAQDISLACTPDAAARLLMTAYQPKRFLATETSSVILATQAAPVLEAWLESWRSAQSRSAGSRIGNVQFLAPPPGSKCWQDERALPSGNRKISSYLCETQDGFPIGDGKNGGKAVIGYWVGQRWATGTDFLSAYGDSFGTRMKSQVSATYNKRLKEGGVKPVFVCHHRYVQNAFSEKLLVESCVSEAVPGVGLYDAVVTLTSMGGGEPYFATLEVEGFTDNALKSASETIINSVHSSGGAL